MPDIWKGNLYLRPLDEEEGSHGTILIQLYSSMSSSRLSFPLIANFVITTVTGTVWLEHEVYDLQPTPSMPTFLLEKHSLIC